MELKKFLTAPTAHFSESVPSARAAHGLIALRACMVGKKDLMSDRPKFLKGRASPEGNNAALARRSASKMNFIDRK